jgi:hypothetical protein
MASLLVLVGFVIVCCILVYVLIMAQRIVHAVRVGKKVSSTTVPFEKLDNRLSKHVLILGDSTMYGAGIKRTENTIGGLLAQQYPDATIETVAHNGDKVADLTQQLKQARFEDYKVIMIGVGGNDIVGMTPISRLEGQLQSFLLIVSKRSREVVLFHCVNVGNTGFFIFPLNYFYSYRSKLLSDTFAKVSALYKNVSFVNLYRPIRADFYTPKTRAKFIAEDSFHPNDYANKFFFTFIWKNMKHLS